MKRFIPEFSQKIITSAEWTKIAATIQNKKVVFTNGCFDIIHLGHVSYLAEARSLGDILVVGLNSDASVKRLKGEKRPINGEQARAMVLAAMLCVDYVILFEEDTPLNLIQTVKPDILVKGGDYSIENIVGAPFVLNNGGSVKIIQFIDGYSTTHTIQQMNHDE